MTKLALALLIANEIRGLLVVAMLLGLGGCVRHEPTQTTGPNAVYVIARTPEGCVIYSVPAAGSPYALVCPGPYTGALTR